MKSRYTTKLIAACAAVTPASGALSHEIDGFGSSHWHAADTLGLVAFGVTVVAALWLSRGGR